MLHRNFIPFYFYSVLAKLKYMHFQSAIKNKAIGDSFGVYILSIAIFRSDKSSDFNLMFVHYLYFHSSSGVLLGR